MANLTRSLTDGGVASAAKNFTTEIIYEAGPPANEVWYPSNLIVCLSDTGFVRGAYGGIAGGLTTGIRLLIVDDGGVVEDLTTPTPIKTNENLATLGSSVLMTMEVGENGSDAIMQVLIPLDGVLLSGAVNAKVTAVFDGDDLSLLDYHEFRLVGTKATRRV